MRERPETIVETEGGNSHDRQMACQDYEGERGYGEYLDGNPCAHCRYPEKAHSEEARKRWVTLWATMTF